jgi:hypothetical protein
MGILHALLGIPTGLTLWNNISRRALNRQNPILNKIQENCISKLEQYCHIKSAVNQENQDLTSLACASVGGKMG